MNIYQEKLKRRALEIEASVEAVQPVKEIKLVPVEAPKEVQVQLYQVIAVEESGARRVAWNATERDGHMLIKHLKRAWAKKHNNVSCEYDDCFFLEPQSMGASL